MTPILGQDGELLAHESGRGIRTLHYYVDGESSAPQRLADAVSGWTNARITTALDPGLTAIRHLDVAR